MKEYRDCLACKASMSEEGTEEEYDKLWCSEKECYVNEEYCCDDFRR